MCEQNALEAPKSRLVEVFDHLDDGRRIEPGEPLVTVGERRLEELDPLALSWCEPLEPQPALRNLEGGVGDVDADDLQERRLLQQRAQQLAIAAAEVEHPCRAARAQRGNDGAVPLLVQAHRLLDRLLFGRALLDVVVNRHVFVDEQLLERRARERPLVFQITIHDQLAIGMVRQPTLAAREQLRDLVVADPIVLLRVEHRDQHIQVRQQLTQPHLTAQMDGVVATRPPLRKLLVERMLHCIQRVAERLEQPPRDLLTACDRQHRKPRLERQRLLGQFRPRIALSGHGCTEHARERNAHERRGNVRTVVDVLVEPSEPNATPDQPHRIDIEQQRGRAALLRHLGIEDVRRTERQ